MIAVEKDKVPMLRLNVKIYGTEKILYKISYLKE